jgi:AcrR family transcriptional regulator
VNARAETRPARVPRRPGPNGVSRTSVTEIQRGRLIAAAVATVDELGYARMTVAEVLSRARVSRKTFYDVFADREDCFLATFDQILAETWPAVEQAYALQSNWHDGVRAALALLLNLMDESPGLAKILVVESLAGGERVLRRRVEAIELIARAIDLDRPRAAGEDQPLVTPEAVVGGVLAVLHTHMVRNDPESLGTLLNPLMSMVVLPYRGPRAAAKELRTARSRDTEPGRRSRSQPTKDPLDGLKMRVTYRTTLVLAAISERPGASNREIAEGSGIVDQGQISKLLRRLAGLGLIENSGAGHVHGAANQWRLTAVGAQLERATRRL